MRCPFCGFADQKVLDSRPAREDESIRRRRECNGCGRRFTTFEEVERPRLFVVKRDGGREEFEREKIFRGMVTACHKRPIPVELIRQTADRVERDLFDRAQDEVKTTEIGERIMEELLAIDQVAFVRFASVYRQFADPTEFQKIVSSLLKSGQKRLFDPDLTVSKGRKVSTN